MAISTAQLTTPLGPLTVFLEGDTLVRACWGVCPDAGLVRVPAPQLAQVQKQVDQYFSGQRAAFTIACREASTLFRRSVHQALCRVPAGQTITYSQLAAMAGHPQAVRATATAVARNHLHLFVPCHRVTPATGGIGRYSAPLATHPSLKAALLHHESHHWPQ